LTSTQLETDFPFTFRLFPSIAMFVALLFTLAAVASAWLVWKAPKPRPKLDVPLLQFDGDNSMLRYLNDTRSLMKKGYADVSSL
jgi:hypothetical protein